MIIYIYLIVNYSLTCREKINSVYIPNEASQARKDVNPQNEKSKSVQALRIQSVNGVCVRLVQQCNEDAWI